MDGVDLCCSNLFDILKCLFCQKKNNLVASTTDSRLKIVAANNIRKDHISKRLSEIGTQTFYYHVTNDCYKAYTNKT